MEGMGREDPWERKVYFSHVIRHRLNFEHRFPLNQLQMKLEGDGSGSGGLGKCTKLE